MIDVGSPKFQLDVQGQTDYSALCVMFVGEKQKLKVRTVRQGEIYFPDSVGVTAFSGESGNVVWSEEAEVDNVDGSWFVEKMFNDIGTYVLRWKSSDGDVGIQTCVVVDAKIQWMMQMLRSMIDKAIKDKTQTWGYTDADLFMYLIAGLNYFNNIAPVTNYNLGMISGSVVNMVVDLASLYAIQAQMMYAVDTDVVYSDQGISLTVDHFSKLASVYDKVLSRIEKLVRAFKLSTASMVKMVMMYNPERARGWLFTQVLTPGFPYFAIYGLSADFVWRG